MAEKVKKEYWSCPNCDYSNFRDYEGLDNCDRCGAEVATRYNFVSDVHPGGIMVKSWREPAYYEWPGIAPMI